MPTPMKIILISPNTLLMDEIRQVLQASSAERVFFSFEGGMESLTKFVGQEHPHLVILDGSGLATVQLEVLERLGVQYPNTAFIVLREVVTPEFLIAAMRIGVKDVLPLPLVHEDLVQAVKRVESKFNLAATVQNQGKVIVFVAGKGGSGATFLACNLGYMLAAEHSVKVALLDLNLQFGDAVLFVSDHVPPNTLADVAGNISRLDASLLASSMVHILPNFGVLAAPEDAERAEEVNAEHIDALLKLARTHYDYVILDIGRTLNATSVKALDYADYIFLVMQETLPFIRDSKRLISILQSLGYAKEKICLLINRYAKSGDIQLSDVEATLGINVYETIPNSYQAVSASVNQGVPMMKIAKNDSVTKALHTIAQRLTEEPYSKKPGWLSHLMH